MLRLVNRGPNAATGAGNGVVLAGDPDRDHRTRVHRAVAREGKWIMFWLAPKTSRVFEPTRVVVRDFCVRFPNEG